MAWPLFGSRQLGGKRLEGGANSKSIALSPKRKHIFCRSIESYTVGEIKLTINDKLVGTINRKSRAGRLAVTTSILHTCDVPVSRSFISPPHSFLHRSKQHTPSTCAATKQRYTLTKSPLTMDSNLTVGGVQQLVETEGHFTNRHQPVLQVINIRRVPANALTDVYWVR